MRREWTAELAGGRVRLVRACDLRDEEREAAFSFRGRAVGPLVEGLSRAALIELRAAADLDPDVEPAYRLDTGQLRAQLRRALGEGLLAVLGGPWGQDGSQQRVWFDPAKEAAPPEASTAPTAPAGAPEAKKPPPPAAAAKPAEPAKPALQSGLGKDVDALVAKSPSSQAKLEAFQKKGGVVEYGPAGGGSYYDPGAKKIVIDGNDKSNPSSAMQGLSHELGHANSPVVVDTSSRAAYVKSTLADEGEATLSNCQAREEIQKAGGPDIGIAGAGGAKYEKIYQDSKKSGDAAAARQAIGDAFGKGEHTSTTGESYEDYYGGWYDKAYGGKK